MVFLALIAVLGLFTSLGVLGSDDDSNDGSNKGSLCINGKAHVYGEVEVIRAATCLESGIGTVTCSVCKGTDEVIIPRHTNHTEGSPVIIQKADCTNHGYSVTYCSVCHIELETEMYSARLGHSFDSESDYECNRCGFECNHESVIWDDDGHSDGCFNSENLYCESCYTIFGHREEWTHSFVSGVCKYCGASEE